MGSVRGEEGNLLAYSDPRWSYAIHLLRQAIFFLVGHEIAHISHGHVDYMESKTGIIATTS